MPCLGCGGLGGPLCVGCRRLLVGSPPRSVAGLVVSSVWVHEDPVPRLIHRLKYNADPTAIGVVVDSMVPLLPPTARCLVPIPRVLVRRWRYGIDPALVLAAKLSRTTGLPMVRALSAPMWHPHRAGRNRRGTPPAFRRTMRVERPVIIDDVVTTGETIAAAAQALAKPVGAVTITSAV